MSAPGATKQLRRRLTRGCKSPNCLQLDQAPVSCTQTDQTGCQRRRKLLLPPVAASHHLLLSAMNVMVTPRSNYCRRAVRPDRLSSATRQCGLSAASSAQRPPAREPRHPIGADRARPIGREVLRPHEVLSEPQRPSEEAQRGKSGCTWGCCLIHGAAVVGRFFQRAREAEGGGGRRREAPRRALLFTLRANGK